MASRNNHVVKSGVGFQSASYLFAAFDMTLGTPSLKGFPGGSAGKKIHLQCERPEFDSWVGKISWRKERLPTPVFLPGEFHGLYNPWGHKELDTTEQLSLSLSMPVYGT